MSHLKRILKKNQPLFQNILNHSFNQELLDGSLPESTYQFFVEQDKLYLVKFAKALQLISERIDLPEKYKEQFKRLYIECVEYEQSMLSSTSLPLISQSFFKEAVKTPVHTQYAEHLLHHAEHSPISVAVAAIVPCFWIYCKVIGDHITQRPISADNPYHEWLSTYTDESYISTTDELINTCEALMADITDPVIIADLSKALERSAEFEYDFFDTCYSHHRPSIKVIYA